MAEENLVDNSNRLKLGWHITEELGFGWLFGKYYYFGNDNNIKDNLSALENKLGRNLDLNEFYNFVNDKNNNKKDFIKDNEKNIEMEWDDNWKRPIVYLIWKRLISSQTSELQLVCICSSQSMANRRIHMLKNQLVEDQLPYRYSIERVPIDHLFGSIELEMNGFDEELSKRYLKDTQRLEEEMENLRDKCREKINELEQEIKELHKNKGF